MTHRMRHTSLEAYQSTLEKAPETEAKVFKIIAEHGPLTNEQIRDLIHWPINAVTPRTHALVERGLVEEHDTIKNQNNRSCIRWRVARPKQQGDLFSETEPEPKKVDKKKEAIIAKLRETAKGMSQHGTYIFYLDEILKEYRKQQ